ncbi:transposase [Nonomuraea phyllanthi]|nr:transposase [Nonomuraea phyllanthi]
MPWRTRARVPWQDLPSRFGSWETVHGRHPADQGMGVGVEGAE